MSFIVLRFQRENRKQGHGFRWKMFFKCVNGSLLLLFSCGARGSRLGLVLLLTSWCCFQRRTHSEVVERRGRTSGTLGCYSDSSNPPVAYSAAALGWGRPALIMNAVQQSSSTQLHNHTTLIMWVFFLFFLFLQSYLEWIQIRVIKRQVRVRHFVLGWWGWQGLALSVFKHLGIKWSNYLSIVQ